MCGIIGYQGERNPKEVIINGLKCLEYRGYDSAGIAILNDGKLKRVRAEGKLENLNKKIENIDFNGHLGIGHTRWATHGAPSEMNAHPHYVDGVSLVHNGIIENYMDLRDELLSCGAKITSETDSELVAHLVAREFQISKDLLKSVQKVLPRLEGAFSIVVASEDQPDRLVAFKNGPPLVIGQGDGETVVASDIQPIVAYTKKVFYLEDFEIAEVTREKVEIYNLKGEKIDRMPLEVSWSSEKAEKHGFPHFMLKEIFEQPAAVQRAIAEYLDIEKKEIQLGDLGFSDTFDQYIAKANKKNAIETDEILKNVERVFIVACGTSYYAGLVGEYLIEKWARVPVEVEFASEFRYRHPVLPKNSLFITISQSGETADTLAALRLANESDVTSLSICNVPGSTIDRESTGHIYMSAGVEVGVASTKAFTSTLALLNIFGLYLGKLKGEVDRDEEVRLVEGLIHLPSQMEQVLSYDKFFSQAAETLKNFKGFLYIGRGVNFPIALEGALKLKELAYMHAEGYAAGEMKHGPIALIDNRMAIVVVAPDDDLYEKTVSNLEEVRARGGQIISIGTEGNKKLKELSLHLLSLPKSEWSINAILSVVPVQLLAYYVANALGHDVDQPRNLAKSVTVE